MPFPSVFVFVSVFVGFGHGLQPLYLGLCGVDVVAPLLALGYLLAVLFACGVAFGDFGRDVVGACQAAFAVEDDALLLVDELLFVLFVHNVLNFK